MSLVYNIYTCVCFVCDCVCITVDWMLMLKDLCELGIQHLHLCLFCM